RRRLPPRPQDPSLPGGRLRARPILDLTPPSSTRGQIPSLPQTRGETRGEDSETVSDAPKRVFDLPNRVFAGQKKVFDALRKVFDALLRPSTPLKSVCYKTRRESPPNRESQKSPSEGSFLPVEDLLFAVEDFFPASQALF